MLHIIISGCNGHMGRAVSALSASDPEVEVVAGFDILGASIHEYPVFASPALFDGEADVVIDFSSPAALSPLLTFAVEKHIPLVLATTGYTQEQVTATKMVSTRVPIFRSANMSVGINVMLELVQRAAELLGETCDIEIVERHHRRKVDAPSGTALMLAQAIQEGLPYQPEYVFERHSIRKPRGGKEIGFSAVRGGTIAGEHQVIFAGHDEVFELHHSASSREIFASGAIQAAKFLGAVTEPGWYSMSDLMKAIM